MLLCSKLYTYLSFCFFCFNRHWKWDYMIIACTSGNCMCQTIAIAAVTVSLFAGSKSYTVSPTAGGTFCPETVAMNILFLGDFSLLKRTDQAQCLCVNPVIHSNCYKLNFSITSHCFVLFSSLMLQTKKQNPLIYTFILRFFFFIILFVYLWLYI